MHLVKHFFWNTAQSQHLRNISDDGSLPSFKMWSKIIRLLKCSRGLNICREEELDVNLEKKKIRVGGNLLAVFPYLKGVTEKAKADPWKCKKARYQRQWKGNPN